MANVNPTFYSDHHTPRRTDPRLIVLQKILGATIDNGGGGAGGGLDQGTGAPVAPPVDPLVTNFYYDTDSGRIYAWNVAAQAWE